MENKLILWLGRKKWQLLSYINPVYTTKALYKRRFGKKLDLGNPKEFNEKIHYLKLNDYYNNPLITKCVDKYRVKEYVEEKGYGNIVAKTYDVYKNAKDINWEVLPESVAFKCNHGGGFNIMCLDKNNIDKRVVEKTLNKWIHTAQWTWFCEPQYKFVERRIVAEEYLGSNLFAYKFYCFNGIPKLVYVSSNGEKPEDVDRFLDFFDMDWNRQSYSFTAHDPHPYDIEKPDKFDEMIEICRKLSEDFPFVRVDLYWNGKKIYFSELTFVPTGGYMDLTEPDMLYTMGSWLKLDRDEQ